MAKRKKISFDPTDPKMKDVIDEIASELGVPPGDVLNLATLEVIEAIATGKVKLEAILVKSNLPRYKRRLDLSEREKNFKKRWGSE